MHLQPEQMRLQSERLRVQLERLQWQKLLEMNDLAKNRRK